MVCCGWGIEFRLQPGCVNRWARTWTHATDSVLLGLSLSLLCWLKPYLFWQPLRALACATL